MQFASKEISSAQQAPHKRLIDDLERHLAAPYQKPLQTHNLEAFEQLLKHINSNKYEQLILDSCCGTGLSSRALANNNPGALVIGIDRSLKRLNTESLNAGELPENCLLLRANCEDIWRLCEREGLVFKQHFLLYPNPYPKTEHLKRRWHGHPVFPLLPKLAQKTELRSNWRIYLEEFELCWRHLGAGETQLNELAVQEPLTLFERKYLNSGQALYQLICQNQL
ncbi:tRNA (guanine(46)-N(7))-methyltransferase TrmB [Agaribacterium haliotis]|uniref:tRNA (guanine(46)-N(7))-methyltransferase TrmB n=1 Tax=Agaribacterium haliotis TaxID=2013869 RepID=UPI000BB58A81|nr:SAM-dependent methyltransferase [Agaribacterium haliotis]